MTPETFFGWVAVILLTIFLVTIVAAFVKSTWDLFK
jgi:hypothetical protein